MNLIRNPLKSLSFSNSKNETNNFLKLYHGSPNYTISPKFGFGEDKHDYGWGFYLTPFIELAKEWASTNPTRVDGWVHAYTVNTQSLKIFDFEKENMLSWIAELMKHRDDDTSRRYRILSKKFIDKYGLDTSGYDIIRGWRADASYFYITKLFVRDEIDISILDKLFRLGELGIQYCLKSETAFKSIAEVDIQKVDFLKYNTLYNERDAQARERMKSLINSDENILERTFSTILNE